MIAHFETSAVVPLVVEEPSLPACERLWNDATRAVSVRLLYAEARAALTMARRLGRLTQGRLDRAVGILDEIVDQIDHVSRPGNWCGPPVNWRGPTACVAMTARLTDSQPLPAP